MSHRGPVKDDEVVQGRSFGLTLTTSPQLIIQAGERRSVSIWNLGSVSIYLGSNPNVTAAAGANGGVPCTNNPENPFIDDETDAAWYGVAASGTCDIRVYVSS